MSKTKKQDKQAKAPVEPFTQFEVGELVVPVVNSYDDLPFDAIVELNELSMEMGEKYAAVADSGERVKLSGVFRDALSYVQAYARAIGQPIDFDNLKQKSKALKDVSLAYSRLIAHFNRVEGADDAAPVEAGEGKNE